MAVEVLTNRFLAQDRKVRRSLSPAASARLRNIQFLHNYLHDVESVWWIAMWSLFYTVPKHRVAEVVTEGATEVTSQEEVANKIFWNYMTWTSQRQCFWDDECTREDDMGRLLDEYKGVGEQMLEVSNVLWEAYEYVEDVLSPERVYDPSAFQDIYDRLIPLFEETQKHAAEDVVFLEDYRCTLILKQQRALVSPKKQSARKRARDPGDVDVQAGPRAKKFQKLAVGVSHPRKNL